MKLNPNNPVLKATDEQWYKLCAVLMHKLRVTEVRFQDSDFDGLTARFGGAACVSIAEEGREIVLRLHTMEEGEALARKHGGLPV